jgi:hypothetical protein
MQSDTFNLKRFLRLVRADLALNTGWIFLGSAVYLWVMTIGCLFKGFLTGDRPIAPYFYEAMLFLSGLFLASMSYTEFSDRRKTHSYLLLPSSPLEKYLSRYLLTSWIYIAYSLLVYAAFIFAAMGMVSLFHGHPLPYASFFPKKSIVFLTYYLLAHSVFFWGALYFRRYTFLKTLIVTFSLPFIMLYFCTFMTSILFHDSIFIPEMSISLSFIPIFNPYGYLWIPDFQWLLYLLMRWPYPALPPILLVVAYFRLKEKEAVHGV